MQPLADKLRRMIEGVPPGGAVTLPREAVSAWLEETGGEGGESGRQCASEPLADTTVPELAAALDRAESTVRGWLSDVPGAYKLHGEWRVPRAAWRAYLDSLAENEGEPDPPTVRSAPSADLGSWREQRKEETS